LLHINARFVQIFGLLTGSFYLLRIVIISTYILSELLMYFEHITIMYRCAAFPRFARRCSVMKWWHLGKLRILALFLVVKNQEFY